MRSVLYLVRKPPGGLANEMIDMMLVSGVFEQPARVLFLDDGVRQLASGQDATLVDRKDTAKALGALPAYDVDELFAHAGSLRRAVSTRTTWPSKRASSMTRKSQGCCTRPTWW